MLGQKTESEGRRVESEGKNGGTRPVRTGVQFAAAFAAGFLLGRRRESDGDAGDGGLDEGQLSEVAREVRERAKSGGTTEQPSSMGSVAGEEAREEEREATSPPETEAAEAQPAGSEAAGIDEEVAQLSAPTTHGMPMFGLGTYQMDEYDECFESVRTALQMGYQHLDTAEGYDNEAAVGDAIVEAEVAREDLFVATKVSPDNLAYDHVLRSAEESLDRLGLDYVDLLYVHWPTGEYEATDTLEAFAELRQEGLVEEIGVSNFTVDLLEKAIEVSEEPIFANQVEMHPLLPQTELQRFCAQDDSDVELVAYSPIARGDVADVTALQEVADKHGATPQQVSLAWLREKDVTAIPKATSEAHLRENWRSLALELDAEDVEKIDAIEERRRIVDPEQAPWNQ